MVAKVVPLASILLVGLADAQNTDSALPEFLNPHAWEVTPEVYFLRCEEPDLMKDEGTFYGFTAVENLRKKTGSRDIAMRTRPGDLGTAGSDAR